jgi:hypothetical protein
MSLTYLYEHLLRRPQKPVCPMTRDKRMTHAFQWVFIIFFQWLLMKTTCCLFLSRSLNILLLWTYEQEGEQDGEGGERDPNCQSWKIKLWLLLQKLVEKEWKETVLVIRKEINRVNEWVKETVESPNKALQNIYLGILKGLCHQNLVQHRYTDISSRTELRDTKWLQIVPSLWSP